MAETESHRAAKVAQRVREELTDMLLRGDIHDPNVAGCIVSDVQVTRDLSLARVFVRLLEVSPTVPQQKRVVRALERANGFIRRTMATRLKLRRAPELRFAWDDVADRGRRIDELLHEIKTSEPDAPGAKTDKGGKS
jgi:ribosome-binding factor A